jgi:hypothetical protein
MPGSVAPNGDKIVFTCAALGQPRQFRRTQKKRAYSNVHPPVRFAVGRPLARDAKISKLTSELLQCAVKFVGVSGVYEVFIR